MAQKRNLVYAIVILFIIFIIFFSARLGTYSIPGKRDNGILCQDLAKEECYDNEECRGIYGPSGCSDGICTADEVFKQCVPIPEGEIEQSKIDKALCENTQGIWERDFYLEPGACQCGGKVYEEYGHEYFIKERGCIDEKTLCIEQGATWELPKKVYFKRISESECDEIPDSEYREGTMDCMIFDDEKGYYPDPNPKCLKNGEEIDSIGIGI